MRTCVADCLSTLLTSQMVSWTWTCSESESFVLLCPTGVPLAAPHLSFKLCLTEREYCNVLHIWYILGFSVSYASYSAAYYYTNLSNVETSIKVCLLNPQVVCFLH